MCEDCSRGMFQRLNGSASCLTCGAGLYQSENGADGCDKCEAGQHRFVVAKESGIKCSYCPRGYFQNAPAQATCLPCIPAKYAADVGQRVCQVCPINTYSKLSNRTTACENCAKGRFSEAGSVICSKCATGYAKVGGLLNFSCVACAEGRFSQAGAPCAPCGAGSYNSQRTQGGCVQCEVGTFSSEVGAAFSETCKDCVAGRYSTAKGATSVVACNPCAPGRSSNVSRANSSRECLFCQAGTFSENSFTECFNCPSGFVQKNNGQASCLPCVGGEYQPNSGELECKKCAQHEYSKDIRATSCDICEQGKYTSVPGQQRCLKCGPGQYGPITGGGCSKCPMNWYRSEESVLLTMCSQCSTGQNTRGDGATMCDRCDLGKYGNASGCFSCPDGLYQDDKGQVKCKRCLEGKIPNFAQTSCAKPEWKVPQNCDHNTQYLNDSDANRKNHTCQACPLGAYCVGPIGWKGVQAKYGWWRLHDKTKHPPACLREKKQMEMATPTCAFAECLVPDACLGASNPNRYINADGSDAGLVGHPEGCKQEDGYLNGKNCSGNTVRCRFCATCIQGYKRIGTGTKCKKCPEQGVNRAFLALGFFVMCVGSALMVYLTIKEAGDSETTSESIKKILLNFLQMVSLAGEHILFSPVVLSFVVVVVVVVFHRILNFKF